MQKAATMTATTPRKADPADKKRNETIKLLKTDISLDKATMIVYLQS